MKIILNVMALALVISLVDCGKKNNRGTMGKAPPNTNTQDFSALAYNPTAAGQKILMSDYIFLNSIPGNKDHKRVYAQMSFFFIKAKAPDTSKKHQYQFFYREFVTCQNGPTPNLDDPNVSYLAKQSGEAILAKGGTLTATGLGTATKISSKTRQGANLVLGQKIHGTVSPVNVVLNFKETSETLEAYQSIKDPADPDMAKAIQNVDCTKPVGANPAATVPYGPSPTPAPDKLDSAKSLQENDFSADTANQDQDS